MLTLLRQNLKAMVLRNKLIVVLFAVCILVSSQALFYVSGEFFSVLSYYKSVDEEARTFSVQLSDNEKLFADYSERIDELAELGDIQNIVLKIDENVNSFYFGSGKAIQYGKGFSDNDTPQIIIDVMLGVVVEIGDMFEVNGQEFLVAGKRMMYEYHEVFYKGLPYDTNVLEINIISKKNLSTGETDSMAQLLSEKFPEGDVIKPLNDFNASNFIDKGKLILLAAITIMSLVNISFLYRYLLMKRKNTYAIYQICGCSKSKGTVIFLMEAVVLTFVPFVLGSLMYKLIIEPLFINEYTLLYKLTFKQMGLVALLYVFMLLVVFAPIISIYSNKTPKELKSSYTG